MKVIETLLDNYWILKEDNEELFYDIKDKLAQVKDVLKTKFGYKIIVTKSMIKLEKMPGVPCEIFGISDFEEKKEYVLLCLILMFLEDKSLNEQFVLSQLIDYIKSNLLDLDSADVSLDFTRYHDRRIMVIVLKFIERMKFIKKFDGDENKFLDSIETEVLYETTGLSKYFMRNFATNIAQASSYMDIFINEKLGLEQDKGDERRHRIYRRIFTEPVVYEENKDDLDYLYIKQFKGIIENDVQNMLDANFFVNKNGAYIMLSETNSFKDVFPNTKAISDIVLLVATKIINDIKENNMKVQVDGCVRLSNIELNNILLQVKEKYGSGFSIEYRTMPEEKYLQSVKDYMKEWYMLRNSESTENFDEQVILPLMFRMCGKYPNDFESVEE